jgi:hypothetical protein
MRPFRFIFCLLAFYFSFVLSSVVLAQTFGSYNSLFAELEFDGEDNYIALDLAESGANSLDEFTVEAWLGSRYSPSGGKEIVISFDASEFFEVFVTGDGQLGFSTSANGSTQDMYAGSLNNTGPHHIAAVYDGVDKILYVDGREIGRVENAHNGAALGSNDVTRYAFIGIGSEATTFNGQRNESYYKGRMDEVRYWQVALCPGAIKARMNYKLNGTEAGLAAYYSFNHPEKFEMLYLSPILNDDSGNGHTGTLYNFDLTGDALAGDLDWKTVPISLRGRQYTVSGLFIDLCSPGEALNFDGVNDYVNVGNQPLLNFTNSSFTLQASVYPTNAGGTIVNKEGEYKLAMTGGGDLQFAIANSSPGWVWVNTGINIPLDTWTDVTFVYDRVGNEATVYTNGGSQTFSAPATGDIGDTAPTQNDFSLGGSLAPPEAGYFKGDMDEVRIWNRALNLNEVQSKSSCELTGSESGLVAYYQFYEGWVNSLNFLLPMNERDLTDISGNAYHGILKNFAQTGPTSNWVAPGSVVTDFSCIPIGNEAPITGVTFVGNSFPYDGTAKSLAITGTLPTGAQVNYTNNSRTDVGSQEVTATITGSNYTTLELKADLTVIPATITVLRASGDYNGNPFEATGDVNGLDGTTLSPAVTFVYEQYDGSNWSGIAGAPTDAGAYRVRSNFAGNTNYTSGSNDWTAFAINQIAATISVLRASGDYNGNPFEATGDVTGLDGTSLSPSVTFVYEQYDGSNWSGIAGAPTDAGAYRVRSNFAGNTNYTSGSNDWIAFAINQISATITVSRTGGDYNGNPFEASGDVIWLDGTSLSPAVTFEYGQYDGSNWAGISGAPTDAGAYRVRSNFAGNTNYNSGSSDWTAFAINKIAATITVTRAGGDYNGNPFEATGTVTGLEGALSPPVTFEYEKYDGSNWAGISGAPTDAGAYRVRSNFAGNTNYTSGSNDWTAFAINQISTTITVSRTGGDYNGNPFEATGDVTGLDGTSLSPAVTFVYEQYDGSNWSGIVGAPTDAGAYRVRSNFAGSTNYNSGSSDWTAFAINKIAATIIVTRAGGDYNGNPFEATGTVTGLEGDLSPSVTFEYEKYDGSNWSGISGAPTDAGAYRVRSNFAGSTNYNSGSSDWTAFAINKIAATITVTRAGGDYNGNPFEATGTVTGLGGAALSPSVTFEYEQYDGSTWSGIAGAPTDAGDYRVRSNFAGNANYTSGSSDWTAFAINKIAASITVMGFSGTYDALAHGATGIALGVEGETLSGLDLGASYTNVPGGQADWTFTDVTGNYKDDNGSVQIVIGKADADVTVTGYTGTYDALAHGATGTALGVEGETLSGLDLGASYTNVPGGQADWTFTDVTGNYKDDNGSVQIAINKADADITVTGYTGTYDALAHGATGTALGVEGETLSGLDLGASFTNVPGGQADWTFTDVTGNYKDDNGSVQIVIGKVTTTIGVQNAIADCEGDDVTLTAIVNSSDQLEVNGTGGTVTFKSGGNTIGTVSATSVSGGIFSDSFSINSPLGATYSITAEYVPYSGNLAGSQTTTAAQLTVLKANISSSIPKNGNDNVVIFDGAASSLGLPSSTTLTTTYQPSPYSGLSYKWYERNEGGSFTLISGSNSSTYQIVANGDFVKEYKVELIVDGQCVGNEIFSKVISVESSCGKAGQNKVQVCHIMPNSKRNTICVSANAVEALLAGSPGSFIGSCNVTYRMEEEPELISVPWNTPVEVINDKILSQSENWFDSKKIKLNINTESYNALQSGFYEMKVEVQETEWFVLEKPITVNVLVADKPLATDVQLSNTMMPRDIKVGNVIGDLSTIDPVDDQHTYSVSEQSDFEVVGQSLIWKGTEIPATARITVFSTDRAGQTIERAIELNREPRFGDFIMFPNPAESDVTIEVELEQSMNVGVRIYDAIGRLVYQEEGVQNGIATYQIAIDHLSAGLYTVQMKTGKLVMNKRLIKK